MPSDVDKVGCAFPGRWRVVVIRQAERYVAAREKFQDFQLVPTRMTELERITSLFAQQLQKIEKPAGIGFEVRWELKKYRTGFAVLQRQPAFQQVEAVDRVFRKPLPVCDEF